MASATSFAVREQPGAAGPMMEDFAALLDATLGADTGFAGSVVTGRVVRVDDDFAVVDVGLKSEGRVPLKEFAPQGQKPEVKPGDLIELFVERYEDRDGSIVLSREKARREEAWTNLEKAFQANQRVNGVIFGRVKGGFTVDLGGAVAFLPGTQVDIRPVRDVGPLMGSPQPFQILKMDRARGNIVVSRRAVLEETRAEQRSELIQGLKEGMVLDGVVKNITDYGAFVDLGGVDGLLHVTDIAWRRINHPSEALTIGQQVKVQVIRFNPETQRISLGMKQLMSDPWDGVAIKYPVQRQVLRPRHQHHRLRRLRGAGAGGRGPGPRLRDELDQEERPPGQDRRHLPGSGRDDPGRGRAEAPHLARPQAGAGQPLGPVRGGAPAGLRRRGRDPQHHRVRPVRRPRPGPRRHGPHVRPVLGRAGRGGHGQATRRARPSRPRCSTSTWRRSASPSASSSSRPTRPPTCWTGCARATSSPRVVTQVQANGIEVKVEEVLTGFIRRAELARDRGDQRPDRFAVGEKVDAKVTAVDRAARRLALTIKGKEVDEEREAMKEYGSTDSGASLGDILGAAIRRRREMAGEE